MRAQTDAAIAQAKINPMLRRQLRHALQSDNQDLREAQFDCVRMTKANQKSFAAVQPRFEG